MPHQGLPGGPDPRPRPRGDHLPAGAPGGPAGASSTTSPTTIQLPRPQPCLASSMCKWWLGRRGSMMWSTPCLRCGVVCHGHIISYLYQEGRYKMWIRISGVDVQDSPFQVVASPRHPGPGHLPAGRGPAVRGALLLGLPAPAPRPGRPPEPAQHARRPPRQCPLVDQPRLQQEHHGRRPHPRRWEPGPGEGGVHQPPGGGGPPHWQDTRLRLQQPVRPGKAG